MKTTQLPPVRVEPSVRAEIEECLREGETLSEFIERSAVAAARMRKAQQEFLSRGRASFEQARRSGNVRSANEVLDGMRDRLAKRMAEVKKTARPKT
jgi:hypothetical protein